MPSRQVTEAEVKRLLERYGKHTDLTVSEAAQKMGVTPRFLSLVLGKYAQRYGLEAPRCTNRTSMVSRANRLSMATPIIHETHEIESLPDDDLVPPVLAMGGEEAH